MKKKKLNFKSITTIISFLALFMAMGVFFYSCADDPVSEEDVVSDENRYNGMTMDQIKEDLISTVQFRQGIDHDRNFRDMDIENSNLRSCTSNCDFSIEDCGSSFDCNTEFGITGLMGLGGCAVHYSFDLVKCTYGGNLLYFQIKDFTWWLDPSCTHPILKKAFDINAPGNNLYYYNYYNNLVTGLLLNNIEENHIYDLAIASGATGWGGVTTVITKKCYVLCDSGSYEACGEGCCIRKTWFEIVGNSVPWEMTQNLQNASLGHCTEPIAVGCSTNNDCNNQLDCDIWTGN